LVRRARCDVGGGSIRDIAVLSVSSGMREWLQSHSSATLTGPSAKTLPDQNAASMAMARICRIWLIGPSGSRFASNLSAPTNQTYRQSIKLSLIALHRLGNSGRRSEDQALALGAIAADCGPRMRRFVTLGLRLA
jgi:hypothetical protein